MLTISSQQSPPAGWDESLADLGGGMFHLTAWAKFRHARGDGSPLYLTWQEDGEPVAFAMAIETNPSKGLLGVRNVTIDSPPLAVDDDNEIHERIAASLRSWARSEPRVAMLNLNCNHPEARWSDLALDRHHETLDFPIAPTTEEELLARMSRSNRSRVRKSLREGMDLREGYSIEDCLEVARLRGLTLAHLQASKGVIPDGFDQVRYASAIKGLVDDRFLRIFIADLDGSPIAALAAGVDSSSARVIVHGSDERARRIGAIRALHVNLISTLSAEGFSSVNLGNIGAHSSSPDSVDHGLYLFKLEFGAEPVLCRSGKMIVRPARAAAVLAARRLKSTSRRVS